jgi:formate-dependent nitrite reductase membrane component NrfD
MTAIHDDAAYEAIFRKYWRRWLVTKSIDFPIVSLVLVAYAVLMVAASGYEAAIRRDVSAIPFAFIVIIGILFLVGRPWSFTAYLYPSGEGRLARVR